MIDQASHLRQLMSGEGSACSTIVDTRNIPSGRARVIAVTSGKGGVGKTMLSVNLAMVLLRYTKRVLIVDADLGLANVDVMLGLESGRHMGHLLLSEFAPEDVASTTPEGISVISGGSGLQQLANATAYDRSVILEKLVSYYSNFDFVIIDTSPGIKDDIMDFIKHAHDILLVTTPEPTALRDTYAAIKAITRTADQSSLTLVVNSSNAANANLAVTTLNDVMWKFLHHRFDEWHHVESDPMVSRSILCRKPIMQAYPKSPASLCIRKLGDKLAGRIE